MQTTVLAAAMAVALLLSPAGAVPDLLPDPAGPSFRLRAVLTAPAAALAKGEIRLLFGWQDARNHYAARFKGDEVTFLRTVDGKSEPIGTAGTLYRGADDLLTVSLHRHEWQMSLVCNRVEVARAEDATFGDGRVGGEATGAGLAAGELELQPTEAIFLADDFMRTDRQFGGWQALTGEWRNNQQGSRVSRSANAFSFLSQGQAEGLAVIGYDFWSEYTAQAAVRSDGTGAVGLVVGCLDKDHYYRLRWTSRHHEDGGTLRLQRVFGGQVTDLTPPIETGFQAGVWYKLQLAFAAGRVLGWIDDVPYFDVAVQGTGEGLVGLWTEPGAADTARTRGALFDDVIIRSYPLLCDDFYRPSAGRWTAQGTGWKTSYGEQGQAVANGDGRLLAGPGWTDGTWSADLKLERGAVGLVIGDDGQGHGYGVRLKADGAELIRLAAPTEILDRSPLGLTVGQWATVSVSRDRGLVRAWLDGRTILEWFDAAAPAGRCGLLAEGARAAADNCQARFEPTFWQPPPTLPAEFEADQYMSSWASPGAAWIQVENSDAHWHKGFFFGDRQVKFKIPGVGRQEGTVSILMADQPTDEATTYRLQIGLRKEAPQVRLRLLHGDQLLAEADVAEPGDEAELLFELRGRFLVVWVNGTCVLEHAVEVTE